MLTAPLPETLLERHRQRESPGSGFGQKEDEQKEGELSPEFEKLLADFENLLIEELSKTRQKFDELKPKFDENVKVVDKLNKEREDTYNKEKTVEAVERRATDNTKDIEYYSQKLQHTEQTNKAIDRTAELSVQATKTLTNAIMTAVKAELKPENEDKTVQKAKEQRAKIEEDREKKLLKALEKYTKEFFDILKGNTKKIEKTIKGKKEIQPELDKNAAEQRGAFNQSQKNESHKAQKVQRDKRELTEKASEIKSEYNAKVEELRENLNENILNLMRPLGLTHAGRERDSVQNAVPNPEKLKKESLKDSKMQTQGSSFDKSKLPASYLEGIKNYQNQNHQNQHHPQPIAVR